jgi:hypothetical protein
MILEYRNETVCLRDSVPGTERDSSSQVFERVPLYLAMAMLLSTGTARRDCPVWACVALDQPSASEGATNAAKRQDIRRAFLL